MVLLTAQLQAASGSTPALSNEVGIHLLLRFASAEMRKLPGSAELQGVSSMSDSDPMPASAMFLATCNIDGERQPSQDLILDASISDCCGYLRCESRTSSDQYPGSV